MSGNPRHIKLVVNREEWGDGGLTVEEVQLEAVLPKHAILHLFLMKATLKCFAAFSRLAHIVLSLHHLLLVCLDCLNKVL